MGGTSEETLGGTGGGTSEETLGGTGGGTGEETQGDGGTGEETQGGMGGQVRRHRADERGQVRRQGDGEDR